MKFSSSFFITLFSFQLAQGAVLRRGYGEEPSDISNGYDITDVSSGSYGDSNHGDNYGSDQDECSYSGIGGGTIMGEKLCNIKEQIGSKIKGRGGSQRNKKVHAEFEMDKHSSRGYGGRNKDKKVHASVDIDRQSSGGLHNRQRNKKVHAEFDMDKQSSRGYGGRQRNRKVHADFSLDSQASRGY